MRLPCVDHDPGDEDPLVEWDRWAESDMIGALCKLVSDAGLTMTLYGTPVNSPDQLRAAALVSAIDRLVSNDGVSAAHTEAP